MSKRKSEYPLIINVERTWPLKKIKNINIQNPKSDFRDDININKEEAEYLLNSLNQIIILNKDVKLEDKNGKEKKN